MIGTAAARKLSIANTTRPQTDFDTMAQNFAEVIDGILAVPRPQERRIELIRHHVRRAMSRAYRAGRGFKAS